MDQEKKKDNTGLNSISPKHWTKNRIKLKKDDLEDKLEDNSATKNIITSHDTIKDTRYNFV